VVKTHTGVGNCGESSCKFGEDSHDDQEETGCIACFAVGATCKGNHPVVLSEDRKWCDCAKTCQHSLKGRQ